ncbi:MAG: hypothetical protein KGS49_13090 [Planctomycetes bacterium]|nr:hypothetical protein [Planctomycetota bacterium]
MSQANNQPEKNTPRSIFDDDLPDLAPISHPTDQPKPSSRSDQALRDALGEPEDLFEDPAEKPAPKKTATPIPQAPNLNIEQLDNAVQLAPVEGHNPRIVSGASVNTKEILSKASKELQKEREEIETVSGAFDSKEWVWRTLGFLSDLRVAITLGILSLAFGAAFYFQSWIPWNADSSLMQLLYRFHKEILLAATAPIQIPLFILASALIPKAANREKKVEPWPFFSHFITYLGPALVGLVSFLLVSLVGNLLASGLAAVKVPLLLRDAVAETVQFACLPILYLSMLESKSYTKPFSMSIFQSISAKSDAWGAMYMQTGIIWAIYFVFWQLGILRGATASAIAGLVFPWFLGFVANQYGVLAGRISDVTELGYEGVFTDNE